MKPTHTYQLLDKLWHPSNAAPFIVVGLRLREVELHGDFSGGSGAGETAEWVPAASVEPWQEAFRGRIRKLYDETPGSLPDPYRYVAAGEPNLVQTLDKWLAYAHHHEYSASLITQLLGYRPKTIRQMLAHERPLWVHVTARLVELFDLSFDELQARYLANAPDEKIAEQRRVEANITELHMMAEINKILISNRPRQ